MKIQLRNFHLGLVLACVASFAVLSCNQNGATGSPNSSNPVVTASVTVQSGSGPSSAPPPTPFNATLNWTANHEAVVNSAGGGYVIYVYVTPSVSTPHGPGHPTTLATSASGQIPSGMPNPIQAPYNTTTGAPAVCTVPTSGGAPSCTITGLQLHPPYVYELYIQAYGNVGNAAINTTGNVTASSFCITSPGSTTGLVAGQQVTDVTNAGFLSANTLIAGLPGTCATGQIQLNQAALGTAVGDTLQFTNSGFSGLSTELDMEGP